VVSSQWFNSLPADYQTALTEECSTAGQATSARIAELNEQFKQELIGHGMEIITDVDLEAFKAAGEKAYEVLGIEDAKAAVSGN
jgi:TRAP-type transport system periplasmic protein